MKVPVLLFFLFLCTAFPQSVRETVNPVQDSPADAVINEDSVFHGSSYYNEEDSDEAADAYRLRKPSPESISRFMKDKELNFSQVEGPANLLEVISDWINEQILRLIQSEGFNIFQEYLSYIIAGAALLIVIIILNKNKLNGIVYGIKETENISFRETKEDINKIDFDELISSCIEKKEFKIAARYYYLKCLKLLSDHKLIELEMNKTNRQYTYEIFNNDIKKPFEELTILFEWIWYGDYPLGESSFYDAQAHFKNFYGRLELLK